MADPQYDFSGIAKAPTQAPPPTYDFSGIAKATPSTSPSQPYSLFQAAKDAFNLERTQGVGKGAGDLVQAWGTAGPHAVVQGARDVRAGHYARGANEMITGAGITAAPMLAPEVLPAIAAAPGAAALTIGAGAAAQQAVPPLARAAGASPDQADLAGTVASLGAGTAMAKIGVPALAKWSANRNAAQMGRDYLQAVHDTQAALGVNAEDVHRSRAFLETVHNQGMPIEGDDAVAQLKKGADVAIDQIEQHVGSLVQQLPRASIPPMDKAIAARVLQMPGASPSDIAAAQKVIAQYGLDQPRSLADAESLRVRLNAENRAVLSGSGVKQRDAVLTDPMYVARQEAANQLRDGVYGTLEQHGIEGVRALRQAEGSIIALRNAADPLTRGLKSESTVARTGTTSLPRRVVQRVAPMAGAAIGDVMTGGNPLGAAVGAEVANSATSGLTAKNLNKNQLLERAFRQAFTSPPVMTVQGVRAPYSSATASGALLPMASHAALMPAALPPGE